MDLAVDLGRVGLRAAGGASFAVGEIDDDVDRPQPQDAPILVVGERLSQHRQQLADCLARRCRADEDIAASLALAESQLVAGQYAEARKTLLASIRRNKGFARDFPYDVSDLYGANAKIAAHLGIDQDYWRSAHAAESTLKHNVPADDYRMFMARIDVAEMVGKTRGHEWARNYYDAIAKAATKAGREDIAAIARLRSLMRHHPEGEARTRAIQKIAESRDSSTQGASLEAKLALARAAYEVGDVERAASIQSELAAFAPKRPILLYAPPIELSQRELDNSGLGGVHFNPPAPGSTVSVTRTLPTANWSTTKRLSENVDNMWVDVAFAINSDGTVSNARIVRKRGQTHWTSPLLRSIQGRRYTAFAPGSAPVPQIERYTYTAAIEAQSGSRTADHSPKARIEFFDLNPLGLKQSN